MHWAKPRSGERLRPRALASERLGLSIRVRAKNRPDLPHPPARRDTTHNDGPTCNPQIGAAFGPAFGAACRRQTPHAKR